MISAVKMRLRKCSLTSILMVCGRVMDVIGRIIGHPLFIISIAILCGIYLILYFNLCGMLLMKDLLGYERQHFICLKFSGRLGNLMFQYAFLYAFAKKKDLAMILPENLELTSVFEIAPNKLEAYGFNKNLCWCFWTREDYWDCAHDEHLEHLPSHTDLSFSGFFQSWMYWNEIESEIRKQFKFQSYIKSSAYRQLSNVLSTRKISYSDTVIVGIHIRRGDYFKPHFKNYGYGIADEKYLKNAMQYFRNKYKKVLFIACSNDISWASQTLSKYEDVHIARGNSPVEDMAILTSTNHTIMTVGTFGWWIGFLTNGTTIYYKYPYVEGTGFSKQFKGLDEHFYPGWIPME